MLLHIDSGILCAFHNIVDGNIVVIGQCQQMLQRNGLEPAFVAGINGLLGMKQRGYLCLGQVVIFPQIPQSSQIQGNHLLQFVKYQSVLLTISQKCDTMLDIVLMGTKIAANVYKMSDLDG